MKNILLMAGAAVSALAFADVGTPVLEGNEIHCLNKKLVISSATGAFTLYADAQPILAANWTFKYPDGHGDFVWFQPGYGCDNLYTRKDLPFVAEGNKRTFTAYATYEGVRWKHFEISYELLADGRVKVVSEGWPCPDKTKPTFTYDAIFLEAPRKASEGALFSCNGFEYRVDSERHEPKYPLAHGRAGAPRTPPPLDYVCYKGDARREVFVTAEPGGVKSCQLGWGLPHVKTTAMFSGGRKEFYLNFRNGVKPASGRNVWLGVDFDRIEHLELPWKSGRNLVFNGSFEEGFKGWHARHDGQVLDTNRWNEIRFALDECEHVSGRRSLKMYAHHTDAKNWRDNFRGLNDESNLGSPLSPLPKGTYTLSFYAKADRPGLALRAWCPQTFHGKMFHSLGDKAHFIVEPKTEWTRHTFTFENPAPELFHLSLNACTGGEPGYIWVDAIQLEKGDKASDYEPDPIACELLTSDKDNFLEVGSPVDARLRVRTLSPNASGTVEVTVTDWTKKELYRKTFAYMTDAQGETVLPLGFDGVAFGRGVFMVRFAFSEGGRETYVTRDRFAIVEKIRGMTKFGHLFGNFYGSEDLQRWNGRDYLRRHYDTGLRSAYSMPLDDFWRQACLDLGIEPGGVYMMTKNHGSERCPPPWLGDVSPERMAEFKERVRRFVRQNPKVRILEMASEFLANHIVDFSKTRDPQEVADKFAVYVKAFEEAVHEVDPKVVCFSDSPYNMSEGGMAEIERILTALHKIGGHVDGISAHIYRPRPESPDLDAGMTRMSDLMKSLGYPDDAKFFFGEGLHYGPYSIPGWNIKTDAWGGEVTWPGNRAISFDLGDGEVKSAAWRMRSWLVAFKFGPRVLHMNSGNYNDFELDVRHTPRLSQIVPTVLQNILGNATFKEDIRFAPYVRTYVFEDEKGRPVAALWCHKDKVDDGLKKAPTAIADFGDSLEGVLDFMGNERKVKGGAIEFACSPTPTFFRGRPGTLDKMIAAFRGAAIKGGKLSDRCKVSVNPATPEAVRVTLKDNVTGNVSNYLVAAELSDRALRPVKLAREDVAFDALVVRSVPETATLENIDWSLLPEIAITNALKRPGKGFAATHRLGWNRAGIFFRVDVKDQKFSHRAFENVDYRWDNDCVQVYFDAGANARSNEAKGQDTDDYDYFVLPSEAGDSVALWRVHTPDRQLTLGTDAPLDHTWAKEIPAKMRRTADGYVIEIFFPADYVRPIELKKGTAFGFGLMVNDANDDSIDLDVWHPHRIEGHLKNFPGPQGCWDNPRLWPSLLLWE